MEGAMDWTSKRTELVTLNTSQRKTKLCRSDHGILQRFVKPRSTPKYPSPRMLLRAPDSPGKSWRNRVTASILCGKMLTEPSGNLVLLVERGPLTGCASPPNSQFVGHCAPLKTFSGKPEVH